MGLIGIGGLLLLGGIYLVFAFIWWLLQIIANWNIFTKAGEAGWKSIIPVYSDYISYKIAWQPSYFWLVFVLGIITSVANGMAEWNQYHNPAHCLTDPNHPCDYQYPLLHKAFKSIRPWNWFCDRSDIPATNLYANSWIWQ